MKKRLSTILFTVLLVMVMVLPVAAEDTSLYIIDQQGYVTDFIPELNKKASELTNTYGINVSCLLTESSEGIGTVKYVEQIYKGSYGEADGIMLIENEEENEWYIYKSGKASDLFTDEDEEAMWDAFSSCEYYHEAVDAYLDKAGDILEAKSGIASPAKTEESSESETESAGGSAEIPDERLMPRLVDDADLLTDEEETELLSKLDEISERQKCDVAVVTVERLGGKTPEAYADDFYDYNGYGFGEERDGIILLISMEAHDWQISTCGFGITAFTDAGQEYMADKFTPLLSDGDFSGAFTTYAELCDDYISQAREGEAYDTGNLPKGTVSPFWILGDLLIGLLIAFLIGTKKKAKLKSVNKKFTAHDYEVPGSMVLRVNKDRFLNKTVTTRKIERSDSSGSSTHSSSSGTTHGGSGGKF